MLSSGADGNGLSPSDQHYCRSEYHAGRKGLALSKSDDGTRAQEDTIGKVRLHCILSGLSSLVLLFTLFVIGVE